MPLRLGDVRDLARRHVHIAGAARERQREAGEGGGEGKVGERGMSGRFHCLRRFTLSRGLGLDYSSTMLTNSQPYAPACRRTGRTSPMLRFALSRLALVVPTFLGVTLLAFVFIHLLPGDPIELMAGERGVDPARHAQLMAEFGFDKPLWEQYLVYLGNVRARRSRPVDRHAPAGGQGVLHPLPGHARAFDLRHAAGDRRSGCLPASSPASSAAPSFDHTVMAVTLTGYSMPIFWWGLLLIIFFSGILGWTPVSGRIDLVYYFEPVTGFMLIDSLLSDQSGAFRSAVSHLILPTIVLGTIPLAVIARQTRSAMIEVLGEDYVRTARAKGLPPWRVVGLHALRNALIPVVTTIGLQTGLLLAGAILTETIFSWPGVGKWLVEAIFRRDYPEVQGGLLLIASFVMLVNLLVDLLYGLVNPRIRHRG